MKKIFLFAVLTLFVTGCSQRNFYAQPDNIGDINNNSTLVKDDFSLFVFSGILQSREIDAASICGGADKVAKVQTNVSAGNVLATIASLGILAPRNYKIYCTKS